MKTSFTSDDICFFDQAALPNPGAVAYRYDEIWQGGYAFDHSGEPYRCGLPTVKIYLNTFPVRRFTPKGFWIGTSRFDEQFICHSWRKKFAHLNVPDAAVSYRRRKEVQISKLRAQLELAKTALEVFERGEVNTFSKQREQLYGR